MANFPLMYSYITRDPVTAFAKISNYHFAATLLPFALISYVIAVTSNLHWAAFEWKMLCCNASSASLTVE